MLPDYNGPRFYITDGGHQWTAKQVVFRVPTSGYEAKTDGIHGEGEFTCLRVTLISPHENEAVEQTWRKVSAGFNQIEMMRLGRDHPKVAIEVRQIQRGVEYDEHPPYVRALVW